MTPVTVLPLPANDLLAYNNTPCTPPTNPLGDIINSLSGASTALSVVFRPGDPNPGANVFTTWVDAWAAISAYDGERILLFDDSLAPCVVTAGTYDFANEIELWSGFNFPEPVLTLNDGVVFQNMNRINGGGRIISISSSPIITIGPTPGAFPAILIFASKLRADGTAPFISVAANAFLVLGMQFSTLENGASAVVDISDPTAVTYTVMLAGHPHVDSTAIAGTGTYLAVVQASASEVEVQTVFLGTAVVALETNAANVGYAPAAPADWVGPAPNDVAEAIDRLAAAVALLIPGPIP